MHELTDRQAVVSLLEQHGTHSLAYATLQPRMRYWGRADLGFAAFRKVLGQHVFLGDPICDAGALETLLGALRAEFPRSIFMQVQAPTADCLREHGYAITPVGVENDIATFEFDLGGKRKADLRHYRNRARAGGVVVHEEADTQDTRVRLQPVCDAWLPLKSWLAHELEFLARPFQTEPEPGTRIFTAHIEGQIVAFVVLDPMHRHGAIEGYTVSILRHLPHAPEGTVDAIVLTIIDVCAREGIPRVSLGVSPFHRIESLAQKTGHGALPVYGLYRALCRWGTPIYRFRGLSFHKSRYRARETPVYTAVRGPIGLWPVYASARACRML